MLTFWTLPIVWCTKRYKITQRFGNWICFRLQVRGEAPTKLDPLETANLVQRLKLALSNEPNRVGASPLLEDGNRSSFRNVVFFRIPDDR
jgi:hypothetical protein